MMVRLRVYNHSDYADGRSYHEPGRAHALTPPVTILVNTDQIATIEKNPDQYARSFVGGPWVGECDYRVGVSGYNGYLYIMRDDAQRLFEIFNVCL